VCIKHSSLLAISLLVLSTIHAEVVEEKRCYYYQIINAGEKQYALKLHIYRDAKTGQEFFASVQYKEGSYIPAVWQSKVIPDQEEELGNYEIRRVEIINGRITGEYLEVRTGAGIKQGKYLEYISGTRPSKARVIFFSAEYSSCQQVCEKIPADFWQSVTWHAAARLHVGTNSENYITSKREALSEGEILSVSCIENRRR